MNATHHRLLVHEGAFAAIGPSGDITGARGTVPEGLFADDARHLSRWQLTIDGTTPVVLAPATAGPRARSALIPGGRGAEPPAHTVFREQRLERGTLVEELRLVANRAPAGTVVLAMTVDADFADQFELRSDHRWYDKPHAVRSRRALPDGIELGYRRQEWHSRTVITAEPAPDAVEETGSGARRLVWRLRPAPGEAAVVTLRVTPLPHGADGTHGAHGAPLAADAPAPERATAGLDTTADTTGGPDSAARGATEPGAGALPGSGTEAGATDGSWPELDVLCRQGAADLAALGTAATGPAGEPLRVPAAGVPWLATLLGRNALLTSLFTLDRRPSDAVDTLLALAAAQATADEPDRVAQPGKIVHEMRRGELAHFGQVPYARYYGALDTTPLFLVLLGAHAEATGDDGPARRLEPTARAAVRWMFEHGGLDAHGYLVYRPDEGGRANQSWKDSPGAICHADGTPARGRLSAAATQGYAYDALRRTAGLARRTWSDPGYAAELDAAAVALRARFVRDFWMPEHDLPAPAVDGDGARVGSLSSDAGHVLWSGLLDEERALLTARRLLRPDFFSGWGVRTLAAGQPAYHPLSQHRGAVWAHDTAVLALGLTRYGLTDLARRVAEAVVATAEASGGRLPEVVAGYGREGRSAPVPHPHACGPRAWTAATPFALLRAVGPGRGAAPAPTGAGAVAVNGAATGAEGVAVAQPPEVSSSASAVTVAQS
ncbi:glycogen debranching N-terminal domain-containing protein [Streptomyces spiramenti]|uniref:Aminotransferase n=1 Tax=Streptomyces spiramenti TaxID=2720606 RepID=A0ABX1APT7_9ACTN|nr:glycogen debranching N-terminal domain-containing protein [Streptomyces spiramenti]NJP69082.1 aminotransferase [Streptomyces spiramenti]